MPADKAPLAGDNESVGGVTVIVTVAAADVPEAFVAV